MSIFRNGKVGARRGNSERQARKKRNRPILKRVILIFVIGAAAALQYTAARYLSIGGVNPNLMLAACVIAGFTIGSEAGGFAGLCLGLYQDAQSGKILGLHALLFLYAGVISGMMPRKPGLGSLPAALIAVYALTVLYEGALCLFAYTIPLMREGFIPAANILYSIITIIIPAAFINAICSVPFFLILQPRSAADAS